MCSAASPGHAHGRGDAQREHFCPAARCRRSPSRSPDLLRLGGGGRYAGLVAGPTHVLLARLQRRATVCMAGTKKPSLPAHRAGAARTRHDLHVDGDIRAVGSSIFMMCAIGLSGSGPIGRAIETARPIVQPPLATAEQRALAGLRKRKNISARPSSCGWGTSFSCAHWDESASSRAPRPARTLQAGMLGLRCSSASSCHLDELATQARTVAQVTSLGGGAAISTQASRRAWRFDERVPLRARDGSCRFQSSKSKGGIGEASRAQVARSGGLAQCRHHGACLGYGRFRGGPGCGGEPRECEQLGGL